MTNENSTPQEIFDSCAKLYSETYDMLKEMTEFYKEQTGNGDFQYMILTLDFVLQFSLLQFALSDNDMDRNEIIFIKNITSTGDVVEYLRLDCGSDITWEKIENDNPEETLNELLKYRNQLVDDARDFIRTFALVDALIPNFNYFDVLNENMCNISIGLCRIDGVMEESEYDTSEVLILQILGMLMKTKEEAEKFVKAEGLI